MGRIQGLSLQVYSRVDIVFCSLKIKDPVCSLSLINWSYVGTDRKPGPRHRPAFQTTPCPNQSLNRSVVKLSPRSHSEI